VVVAVVLVLRAVTVLVQTQQVAVTVAMVQQTQSLAHQ
jgi:hypothetical protein